MMPTSPAFFLGLAAVVVLYHVLPRACRAAWLLAVSYSFCMLWSPLAAAVLLAQTLTSYACARAMAAATRPRIRNALAAMGVALALAILAAAKYTGFLAETAAALLHVVGLDGSLPQLHILVPLGLSFYTLQIVGYLLDVRAGRVPAERNLAHYALFVAFFPTLPAGPIERAARMLPQHRTPPALDPDAVVEGLKLIVWGLFKKAVIADRLAAFVDLVYASPGSYTGSTLALAAYAFAFQIYCDFSGYSDIAIGSARLFGYRLAPNFRAPYAADSIVDFWRRWHIALSSWFRDYLYIPLGGSRATAARWALNIAIVFGLSGLWHGASWTFVAWGLLHALYYLAARAAGGRARRPPLTRLLTGGGAWKALRVLVVFHAVTAAWIVFRAPTLAVAGSIFRRIATGLTDPLYVGPSQWNAALSAGLVLILLAIEAAQTRGAFAHYPDRGRCPAALQWVGYGALLLAITLFAVPARPFVYFQF